MFPAGAALNGNLAYLFHKNDKQMLLVMMISYLISGCNIPIWHLYVWDNVYILA